MFPKDEMLGFCSSCGVKIISLGRTPKFLKNFKEHYISLSNGTLMKVGVCDMCRVELVSGDAKKMAEKILENHKEYWKNRTKKVKFTTRDIPKFFEKLEVKNPNTNPVDFLRKKEKDKREKQELKAMSAAESVAYHSR